jgi:aspartate dehydrogenase
VRLGLIGYGAIGKHVEAAGLENIELVSVLVKRPRPSGKLTHEPERFFAHRFDAVAECAGHEAVRAHGQRVLERGADFLVTSVGAFTDTALFDRLLAAAKASGRRLILPSAGIGALDILSSAAVGGLDSVTVTVRKDPSAWKARSPRRCATSTRSRSRRPCSTARCARARGSIRRTSTSPPPPRSRDSARRTRVVIVADPTITTHIVELEATGAFGRFTFREDVAVSEENRKTGKLVAMAMVKSVRQLASTLVVAAD